MCVSDIPFFTVEKGKDNKENPPLPPSNKNIIRGTKQSKTMAMPACFLSSRPALVFFLLRLPPNSAPAR